MNEDLPETKPPLVVTGMHRSGTSLLASLCAKLGVAMGSRMLEADAFNPEGYHEDRDFLALQSRMLHDATPEDDGGHRDWGWTEHQQLDRSRFDLHLDAARQLIGERVHGGRPWGWKNPRTTVQLDFWDHLIDRPQYLLIYRFPWEVADSMQRLGADVFLRHPEYAYRIWSYYNQELLDFLDRAAGRAVLISANAMVAEPERLDQVLRRTVSASIPEGFVRSSLRPELFHATANEGPLASLLRAVRPQCIELLMELDRRAELSGGHLWQAPVKTRRSRVAPPRLSVVVPCFNHGEFLLEAIASVERAAGDEPVELVVVDDASTDPWTLQVLEQLRGRGYQILEQPHRGLAGTRNAGVAAASGRYILPLDADNRVRPGFIAAALAALESDPKAGVCYSHRFEFGLRQGVVEVPEFELRRLLLGNYVDACAVLRREVWQQCGGWDPALSAWEDWDLWIGAGALGWRFLLWPEVGFDYRVRPDSLVSSCASEAVGAPLQEYIVRKHEDTYRRFLPELLRSAQDSQRAADAATTERNELVIALERERSEAALQLQARIAAHDLLVNRIQLLEEQALALVADRDRLAAESANLERELQRGSAEREALRAERDALGAERDALGTERDALGTERDALRTERDALRTERDALRTERDALRTEGDALRTEGDALRTEGDALSAESEALRAERDALYAEREALRAERYALYAELGSWELRVRMMESTTSWRLRNRVLQLRRLSTRWSER